MGRTFRVEAPQPYDRVLVHTASAQAAGDSVQILLYASSSDPSSKSAIHIPLSITDAERLIKDLREAVLAAEKAKRAE